MPKVMFTISYSVKPEARESYLALAGELKKHFTAVEGKNYAVYETRNRKNHFTEVFVSETLEEFDALEDTQDERSQELVGRLESIIDDDGMKYSTFVEVV